MTRSIFVALYVLCATSLFAMSDDDEQVRLIFMGRTGVGKSTSVIAFYNFALDVAWDTFPKHFPIPTSFQPCNVAEFSERCTEVHARGQLNAVTQVASEYRVTRGKLSVSIIDSPGVADPRGIEMDRTIVAETAKFLVSAGPYNALCIVLPGSLSRATIEEKYALEEIKLLIPQEALDRVFVVVTHTSVVSENIRQFVSAAGLPTKNIFALDNLSISEEGHQDFSGIEIDRINDGDAFGDDKKLLAREVRQSWRSSNSEFLKLVAVAHDLGQCTLSVPFAEIANLLSSRADAMGALLKNAEELELCRLNRSSAQAALQLAEDMERSAEEMLGLTKELFEEAQANLSKEETLSSYAKPPGEKLFWTITPECAYQHMLRVSAAKRQLENAKKLHDDQRDALKARTAEKLQRLVYHGDVCERVRILERDEESLVCLIAMKQKQLSLIAMSSKNPHVIEYLEACIRSEQSPTRRAKLAEERHLMVKLLQ